VFVCAEDFIQSRLARIQALWDDERTFARIIESGRYLKLCATKSALEEAWDKARGGASSEAMGSRKGSVS
jgi:hypothetical protein